MLGFAAGTILSLVIAVVMDLIQLRKTNQNETTPMDYLDRRHDGVRKNAR